MAASSPRASTVTKKVVPMAIAKISSIKKVSGLASVQSSAPIESIANTTGMESKGHYKQRTKAKKRSLADLGREQERIVIDDDDDKFHATVQSLELLSNLERVMGQKGPAQNVLGDPPFKRSRQD